MSKYSPKKKKEKRKEKNGGLLSSPVLNKLHMPEHEVYHLNYKDFRKATNLVHFDDKSEYMHNTGRTSA